MSTFHFSDILIVLKNTCLKSCERIYAIDFSFLSKSALYISVFECRKLQFS